MKPFKNPHKQRSIPLRYSHTSLKSQKPNQANTLKGSHNPLSFTLQLFKNSKHRIQRVFATLANNGTISFHSLENLVFIDPKAQAQNAKRHIWVSYSLDTGKFKRSNGSTGFSDNNKGMFDILHSPVANSVILSQAKMLSLMVPTNLSWDNTTCNEHAYTLKSNLESIESANVTDSEKEKAYQLAWDAYNKGEQALVDKGFLTYSNVLVARPNGVTPAFTFSPYIEYSNPSICGAKMVGNPGQDADTLEIINEVQGVVRFNPIAIKDPLSAWEYGIRQVEGGRKTFSVEVLGVGMFNSLEEQPMTVLLSDLPFNSDSKRAENFKDFVSNNTYATIRTAELHLRTIPSTLASTFVLSGQSLTYSSAEVSYAEVFNESVDLSEASEVLTTESDEF